MTLQMENKLSVILLMVMSANGVVAQKRIENSFEWNSEADRVQFLEKINDIGTAIMGSNTYRSIGSKPYPGIDVYVLTNHPEQFRPHDRVTFVSGDITDIYEQWRCENLGKIALLGGPSTNRLFLEKGLVDEIYLTIEPTLLPEGLHLAENLGLQIDLKLKTLEVLNEEKTLLLHYSVLAQD